MQFLISSIIFMALAAVCIACSFNSQNKSYTVQKTASKPGPDAGWQDAFWKDIRPLTLTHYMGDKPGHFPRVQAKMVYDDGALYLIWKVDDQYVRAVSRRHQDEVYKDSCVEFFFAPDNAETHGYFNLEMNCGGLMLFHHQLTQGIDVVPVTEPDMALMQIAHSLPRQVDPEMSGPVTWSLAYSIPFSVLSHYSSIKIPGPGDQWRANFFKIADATSHPHWLTWAKVNHPVPRFHLPEYFGTIIFQ